MNLDATDVKLLELIQKDCKRTNKELSVHLNLSVTAVYERLKKLERIGVIRNYVALVDPAAVHRDFMVLCNVSLEKHNQESITYFEREISKLPEVIECMHVSGDSDYVLKVHVKDMTAYREFVVNKLTTLKHIGSTYSTFVINRVKNTTEIPV